MRWLTVGFWIVVFVGMGCKPCGDATSDEDILACVTGAKKRDILKNPKVKDYLKHHKVYVSLTTSPTRIHQLMPVLKTIDTEHIESILLALPKKYGRDQSEYVIPQEVREFKKLKILRIEEDLGPITKLLPAILYTNYTSENQNSGIQLTLQEGESFPQPDEKAIIITIDDDSALLGGAIAELIYHSILKNAVVASSGANLGNVKIERSFAWPERFLSFPVCLSAPVSFCDIVEGYGAVAYKPAYIDIAFLRNIIQRNKQCYLSDDLVISFGLAYRHVPRLIIQNTYIYPTIQYQFGLQKDALHLGAGQSITGDVNTEKYNACYHQTLKEVWHEN